MVLSEGVMLPVQAMGAITPAMTAAVAFALLGAVETWATLATLVPVMAGIVLAAGFEPSYNAFGLAACMGAAAARALKAVLQVRALMGLPLPLSCRCHRLLKHARSGIAIARTPNPGAKSLNKTHKDRAPACRVHIARITPKIIVKTSS